MAETRTPTGKLVIGVTGGIGSGKSTAAHLFAEHGAAVIDTDTIAAQLTQPGAAAIAPIVRAFGPEYLTAAGALDRAKMRERVFSDLQAKRTLEAILHPLIRGRVAEQVAQADAPYVLVLIPLLIETGGYPELVERVLVIDVLQSVQITRTMERSGLTEASVRAILQAQASREQRLAQADDVIDNNADLAHLRSQVEALHERYRTLAAQRA